MDESSSPVSIEPDTNYEEHRSRELLPDLLLRPLGDNLEWRHVLRGDLEERLEHAHPSPRRDGSAQAAAAWLEKHPRVTGLLRLRTLIWLASFALVLFLAAVGLNLWKFAPEFANNMHLPLARKIALEQFYDLPAAEAPFDPYLESGDEATASRRGWQAHPDSPMHYHAYVMGCLKARHRLPDQYEETWQRLDPDNGYWLTLEALAMAPSLTTGGSVYSHTVYGHTVPPAKFNSADQSRALELLEQAAGKLRWQSYRESYKAYRASHTRPAIAFPVAIDRRDYVFQWYDGVSEAAWNELKEVSDSLAPGATPVTGGIRDEIASLKMEKPDYSLMSATMRTRGLAPATFYFTTGFVFAVTALALLVCSLAMALRLVPRHGRPGKMALCLAPLLRPRDVLVILGAGLAGPVTVVLALKAQDLTAEDTLRRVVIFVLLTLPGMLVSMTWLARLAASRRLRFLGMGASKTGSVVAAILLAGVWAGTFLAIDFAAMSFERSLPHPEIPFGIAGALAAPGVLWLPLRALLGYVSPDGNVRHRLIALQLLAAFLIAAIFFGTATLALYPLERKAAMESEGK